MIAFCEPQLHLSLRYANEFIIMARNHCLKKSGVVSSAACRVPSSLNVSSCSAAQKGVDFKWHCCYSSHSILISFNFMLI